MVSNLGEKLELMQWLSERGFQGNAWINLCGDGDYEIYSYKMYEEMYSWMPLEQVLGLLPPDIEFESIKRYYDLIICKHNWMGYKLHDGHERLLEVDLCYKRPQGNHREALDHHLAALKLLKQVIDQYGSEVCKESERG